MKKILRNGVIIELTDEEFEKQYPVQEISETIAPSIEERVAALESAIVDLALNNTEVVNNA